MPELAAEYRCSRCRQILPVAEFSAKRTGRGRSVSYVCRGCCVVARQERRLRHPGRDDAAKREAWKIMPADEKRRIARAHLLRKWGLTAEEYQGLKDACLGLCQICGNPPLRIALHVDHDHETGAIRGLLCVRCNTALGWFERNTEALASYLTGGS